MAERSSLRYERVNSKNIKVIYEENGKRTETIVRFMPENLYKEMVKNHDCNKKHDTKEIPTPQP